MKPSPLTEAMRIADLELTVEPVETTTQLDEAYRLRHQVYCLERGFEPGNNGRELDAFDAYSQHAVLRQRATGQVIGTVRMVLPAAGQIFPMQEVCGPCTFRALPAGTTAEISRFAISKELRGVSSESNALSRLMLVRGLVQLSHTHGVTHWCAMMEKTLLRLLRASAIHFRPLGPAVEYHGMRQPAACEVRAMLGRMADEQPAIYDFVAREPEPIRGRFRRVQARPSGVSAFSPLLG